MTEKKNEGLVPISSAKQLLGVYGFRPVILQLVAQGYDERGISKAIADEYGYKASPRIIKTALETMGGHDLQKVGAMREVAELHKEVIEAARRFKEGFEEAEAMPETTTDVDRKGNEIVVPNRMRKDLIDLYSRRWGEWVDRWMRVHDIGTPRSTTNVISGDVEVNPVQVVLDEMRNGAIDAEGLDRVINRLEEDGED